ncbi:hypothetical protein [Streptomyces sp. SID8352]|uniref:hypothetical protein n=1 Tax=Streptomyces sp. SID8352 TaxID=2690338 RepID=UPI00136BEA5E|nr:hypothetical protein [Streptomyces sp. SID8352]MYU24495.1 hypothetical protein [Streptomyces sp. SID8352]
MSETPDTLTGPVRALLTAISETLTLPHPGRDYTDLAGYEQHASDRITWIQATIRDVLGGDAILGLQWEADYLRKQSELRPADYRTVDEYIAALKAGGGQ